jgi:hypothetical protein
LQAANVVPWGLWFCRTINQADRPAAIRARTEANSGRTINQADRPAPIRARPRRIPAARSTKLIVRRQSGPDRADFRPHDQRG